ncbi:hypothetical protein ABT026_18420 [Streptomyces sp. NPDC002734]|uniref:hypothetical protein n=1 Tax=Streptomyces sp. NPDC002734 TaxID=3154426 RepID=UPI0033209481
MQPALKPYTKALALGLGAAPFLLLGKGVDEITFTLIVSPIIVLVGGYWWWKTRKTLRAEAAKGDQRATEGRLQPRPVATAPSPSGSERSGRSTATASRNVGRSRAGVQQRDRSKMP